MFVSLELGTSVDQPAVWIKSDPAERPPQDTSTVIRAKDFSPYRTVQGPLHYR